MALWRMSLDVPYDFCIERSFLKSQHCKDFAPSPNGFNNTWRCPVTGLVMLRPSFNTHDLTSNFVPLSSFRYVPDFWQVVNRQTAGGLLTSLQPATKDPSLIEILVRVAIMAILANATLQDDMKWALESTFTLGVDEGFALWYHGLTDEMLRKENWFCLQWDNIGLHFNHQGHVRCFQYNDRNDLTAGMTLFDEFDIGSPGDFLNKQGWFIFLPIPDYGLVVYHYRMAQKMSLLGGSVNIGSIRGHLIPWKTRTVNGVDRLLESAKIHVGVNPYQQHLMGLERIVFAPTGTYTDGIFDPGVQLTHAPLGATPGVVPTDQQNITSQILNKDGTAAWDPLVDKAFCVQSTLTTTDNRYTPFLYGYTADWDAVYARRNTTPLVLQTISAGPGTDELPIAPDRLLHLQWSEDEDGRFEGTAQMLLTSVQGKHLAKRGDATFLLEYSLDNGVTWITLFGGFAKKWALKPSWDSTGFYYRATCSLLDMNERFQETHLITDTAYDGMKVGDAINALLKCAQEPPLASLPAYANSISLPVATGGKPWSFKPRAGDKAERVLMCLLMFLHTQGVEWRIRYDWAAGTWILDKKPHDVSTGALWKLTPIKNQQSLTLKTWAYGQDGDWDPEPPEGNLFVVIGMDNSDTTSKRAFSGTQVNKDSLTNLTSLDYLGRDLAVFLPMDILPDTATANKMLKRVYDAAAHHRDKCKLPIPDLQMALTPNTHVQMLDTLGNVELDGWIKRRDVIVSFASGTNNHEQTSLTIDSVWERERTKG